MSEEKKEKVKLNDNDLDKVTGGFYPGSFIRNMAGKTVEYYYTIYETGEMIYGTGILTGRVEDRIDVTSSILSYCEHAELTDGKWVPCCYINDPSEIPEAAPID